tara:strand:- start:1412 stop:2380 length:969 start_codon:yes stop_codon:yes gene_type:complete
VATKPDPYQDLSWIRNDGLLAKTPVRPADGVGRFEYWTGSFKEAFDSRGDVGTPFKSGTKGGLNEWQDSGTFGDNMRLKLINNDGNTTSGYFTVKLADGWQGMFYVKTENNDYFEDLVQGEFVTDNWNDDDDFIEEFGEAVNLLEDAGYPSIWVQDNAETTDSRMIAGLDSGDYISFDIDSESSNAGQARVRLNGEQFLDNVEADNEIWVTCVYLRFWNADYQWPPIDDDDDDDDNDDDDDDDNDNDDDPPFNPCQEGYELNDFGICVPIPEPEPVVCGDGFVLDPETNECVPIKNPEDDVTIAGMIVVIAGIAGIVVLALR